MHSPAISYDWFFISALINFRTTSLADPGIPGMPFPYFTRNTFAHPTLIKMCRLTCFQSSYRRKETRRQYFHARDMSTDSLIIRHNSDAIPQANTWLRSCLLLHAPHVSLGNIRNLSLHAVKAYQPAIALKTTTTCKPECSRWSSCFIKWLNHGEHRWDWIFHLRWSQLWEPANSVFDMTACYVGAAWRWTAIW